MNKIPTPAEVKKMNHEQRCAAFSIFMAQGYSTKQALKMAGL